MIKKILALSLMTLFTGANAQNIKINGYDVKVEDPRILQNIKDIASCSPKKYAQKEDFEEAVFYTIIKRPDLLANKLKNSCVVLNNKELLTKAKAQKESDENFGAEIYTPLEFANSPESLLYLFTAKAPLEQSEGMKLSMFFAQLPTYFVGEAEKEEKQFRQEAVNVLKSRLDAKVANISYNLDELYKPTPEKEDQHDKMLAILIPWDLAALKVKTQDTGDTIAHKVAYMGRYHTLNSIMTHDRYSMNLGEVNKFNETPLMMSFRPYCGIKEGWQKQRLAATQQMLIKNIMYTDMYRKNINGQTFADYVKTYMYNEKNPEINKLIVSSLQTKSTSLLNSNDFTPVKVDYKDEFCK